MRVTLRPFLCFFSPTKPRGKIRVVFRWIFSRYCMGCRVTHPLAELRRIFVWHHDTWLHVLHMTKLSFVIHHTTQKLSIHHPVNFSLTIFHGESKIASYRFVHFWGVFRLRMCICSLEEKRKKSVLKQLLRNQRINIV